MYLPLHRLKWKFYIIFTEFPSPVCGDKCPLSFLWEIGKSYSKQLLFEAFFDGS